jgi:hypothetical protein
LNENGHLTILNAQKRRKVIRSSQKKYSVDHETSPLFDTKMPKAKPIVKLMETCLKTTPNESH